ncbi:hypothetical protein NPIL_264461 [Nephila pilipes]|uniref:Uncharacterized protein n=1 Tax=Nephila pilipes TaxID=299642 RepID=A0A8X6Q145_NEPPI|nr:hypothetical protein NPIL_264461 [Nephila pilipes]
MNKGWQKVFFEILNSIRRNLWTNAITERVFEEEPIIEYVFLRRSMDLDVSNGDVEKLETVPMGKLTIEKLKKLKKKEHKYKINTLSSDVREIEEKLFFIIQINIFQKCGFQNFVRKQYHPHKNRRNKTVLNDQTSHFRKVQKRSQRKVHRTDFNKNQT